VVAIIHSGFTSFSSCSREVAAAETNRTTSYTRSGGKVLLVTAMREKKRFAVYVESAF
jgi:hypothetical protein